MTQPQISIEQFIEDSLAKFLKESQTGRVYGLKRKHCTQLARDLISFMELEEYEQPAYDFEKHKLIPVFRLRLVEDALSENQ